LTPFGDALGSGIASEYISQRTGQPGTTGWSTHGIIPQVNPLTPATLTKDTLYLGEFASDLSAGVIHSYTPLTSDPNVATVSNLYLRTDTRDEGTGSYTLLSACPGCSQPLSDPLGLYHPQVAATTFDMGHVLFEASARLTSDAPPPSFFCTLLGICTPDLYEWDHGTLRFVGILPDGSAAPISIAGMGATQNHYTASAISADGSKIFFTVPSSASVTNGGLYMRRDHATTVQLNASERTDCVDHDPCTGAPEPDPAGSQPAQFQAISADGRKVFFTSAEELTDTAGGDLYVYDTTLPVGDPNHIQHVYADNQPVDGSTPTTSVLGTSADGSYVYFTDQSALLPGQAALPDAAPVGLYIWHNGVVSFLGSVDSSSTNGLDGNWASGEAPGARVTPDGRTLLFTSHEGAGLAGYDHGTSCGALTSGAPCAELYVYKADSGRLPMCVSCGPPGTVATANAIFNVREDAGGAKDTSHLNHPLTDDGDHVFFETGERLVPEDVDGKHTDVYEWTVLGSGGCQTMSANFRASADGCLSLISSGQSSDDSHFLDATPSGHDVFFTTSQALVGWDTDNNYDLYDARVGGGFPGPVAATPECTGEACQGLIGGPPASFGPATSSDFHGSGNVLPVVDAKKPVKKCAKGKVRKRVHGKVKCVKKPKHKKAKRAAHRRVAHKHAT